MEVIEHLISSFGFHAYTIAQVPYTYIPQHVYACVCTQTQLYFEDSMTISTCVCVTLEFDNAFSIFYVWHKYLWKYICVCVYVQACTHTSLLSVILFHCKTGNVWSCQEALLFLWRSCPWWTSTAPRLGCNHGQSGGLFKFIPKASFQVWKYLFRLSAIHRRHQVKTYSVCLSLSGFL